jgi:hypothetical protein
LYSNIDFFGTNTINWGSIALFRFLNCVPVSAAVAYLMFLANRFELRRHGVKGFHKWAIYFSCMCLGLTLCGAALGYIEFYLEHRNRLFR